MKINKPLNTNKAKMPESKIGDGGGPPPNKPKIGLNSGDEKETFNEVLCSS